jgi:hypothetical protein
MSYTRICAECYRISARERHNEHFHPFAAHSATSTNGVHTSTTRGDYIPNNASNNSNIEMWCPFREVDRGNLMYFVSLGENVNHFPVTCNFPLTCANFTRRTENNIRSQQGGGDHIPNHILHSRATIRSSSGNNDYDGRLQHGGGDYIPNHILHSGASTSSLDHSNGSDEDNEC